jgi:hypothetical protein
MSIAGGLSLLTNYPWSGQQDWKAITRSFDDTNTNTRTIPLVWDESCMRAADRFGCTVHKAFL